MLLVLFKPQWVPAIRSTATGPYIHFHSLTVSEQFQSSFRAISEQFQSNFRAVLKIICQETSSDDSLGGGAWFREEIPGNWEQFQSSFRAVWELRSSFKRNPRRGHGEKGRSWLFLPVSVLLTTAPASADSSAPSLPADIRWNPPLPHPPHSTRKQLISPLPPF